jgi:hypothetical protein
MVVVVVVQHGETKAPNIKRGRNEEQTGRKKTEEQNGRNEQKKMMTMAWLCCNCSGASDGIGGDGRWPADGGCDGGGSSGVVKRLASKQTRTKTMKGKTNENDTKTDTRNSKSTEGRRRGGGGQFWYPLHRMGGGVRRSIVAFVGNLAIRRRGLTMAVAVKGATTMAVIENRLVRHAIHAGTSSLPAGIHEQERDDLSPRTL